MKFGKDRELIHDYTKGPIFGPLVRFSIPFMISNALQVLYAVVDMYIVGLYTGHVGLSAVANASRIFVLTTMISVGLTMSGQIYVAQLIGKGDRSSLSKSIGTFFTTILSAGAIISLFSLITARWMLGVTNVPAEAFNGAYTYLIVTSAGLVFVFGYNMVSSVLRGMGDSSRPLLFVAIACVLNIILDFIFIALFGMGLFGAALATVIAQALSFAYSWRYLSVRSDKFGFDFKLKSFMPDMRIFKSQMKLSIPFTIRFAAINVSMLYIQSMVNSLGLAASTIFLVGIQLDDIVTKVTQGIMQATTAMVGQNYGARRFDRVRQVVRSAWLFASGFYIIYTFFLLSYPEEMFGLFTNEPEIVALAPLFAWNIVWQFPALVLMRGTNGFIHGIGNANLSLIFGLFDGVVLRIGCSWFLGAFLGLGLKGYILGYAIASYGMGVPTLFYYWFCPWQKRKSVV